MKSAAATSISSAMVIQQQECHGPVRFEGAVLYASTDADTAAELVIRLPGVSALTAADLLL